MLEIKRNALFYVQGRSSSGKRVDPSLCLLLVLMVVGALGSSSADKLHPWGLLRLAVSASVPHACAGGAPHRYNDVKGELGLKPNRLQSLLR